MFKRSLLPETWLRVLVLGILGASTAATRADAAPPGDPAGVPAGAAAAPPASGANRAQMTDAGGREYSIVRDGDGVTITGPGVSITSQPASAIATTAAGGFAPVAGTERRSEPLRCQGAKFLRLDNQRLAFSGDGIVAEGGCEIYLTNSRIDALGTALVADAARIHLTNSTLVGGTGSLTMQNGAEIYVGGSTLKGMSRRFDTSQLHDLGGNHWD